MGTGMALCAEVGEREWSEEGGKMRRYRFGYSEDFVEPRAMYEVCT
jgi:hypothetical protein